MSVEFTIGNYQYSYNQADLQGALTSKGVEAARIDEILNEIEAGSLQSLKDLGLSGYVTITWVGGADIPPATIGGASFISSLEKMETMNFVEIMQVLNEAAMQLRQANREMRHAERDAAMQESYNAADKIRSSALINLAFGIASGIVNIGMGAVSVVSSAVQLGKMKGPATEMKSAKVEMNQIKADADLGKAQMKLGDANADMKAIKVQEQKVADLQTKLADAPDVDKPAIQAELDDAKIELGKQQSALEAKLGLPDGSAKTPAERTAAMEKGIGELEGEVKGLSAKAEKANNAQKEQLQSEIDDKKAEIKKLEGKTDTESKAQLETAKKELAGLETKLNECNNKGVHYSNPTGDEALAAGKTLHTKNASQLDPVTQSTTNRFSQAQSELNHVVTRAQTVAGLTQGINTAAGGVNQIAKGAGDVMAAEQQAEQAEHTAKAQKHSAGENESSDYQNSFTELAKNALQLMKECLQAQNQANASIYRNM